jgi:hypothetical protein
MLLGLGQASHIIWDLVRDSARVRLAKSGQSEAAPDPSCGLYAIWVKPGMATDNLPFVKGGQVIVQWEQVQPAEDRYDFSPLREQLEKIARLGRVTTVQLNANRQPAFLSGKVPLNHKMFIKEQDSRGTFQYWHPAYVKAYTDLIAAFAKETKSSPYRSTVIGVRLNYNAIGTEGMVVPPEERSPAKWVAPTGVEPAPQWTEEIATGYRRTIENAFLGNFSPEIRVFLRSGIPGYPGGDPESLRLAGTGKFGLFTTGSEIEPRNTYFLDRYTAGHLGYCRTGKTVCYAESMADATGKHGSLQDQRWCSPEQYNYWRLLSDLNQGFSMIGVYGSDLVNAEKPEYRAAFDFAVRYAGYHASPSVAPGAWVALREGSFLLKGDYTFLMRRLEGMKMKPEQKIGPDDQRFGAWALTLPKGAEVKFALDPDFARSLAGRKVAVRVIYLDQGSGAFTVRTGRTFPGEVSNSGRWKAAENEIDGASLAAGSDGEHIVIQADIDLTLHMVEVARRSSQ